MEQKSRMLIIVEWCDRVNYTILASLKMSTVRFKTFFSPQNYANLSLC
jgi:hypothetical protein